MGHEIMRTYGRREIYFGYDKRVLRHDIYLHPLHHQVLVPV